MARYRVLIALVGIGCSSPANAEVQPGAGSMFNTFLLSYQQASDGWVSTLYGYANTLFWELAALEMAWSAISWALQKDDFNAFTGALIRKIFAVNGFYLLLLTATPNSIFPTPWPQAIINSFTTAATAAGGTSALMTSPGGIFGLGIQIAAQVIVNTHGSGLVGSVLAAFFATVVAIIIAVCFAFITALVIITTIESYIIISAGVLMLGFGGSKITQDFVNKYFTYAVSVGVKLFVLYLIVGLGQAQAITWANNLTTLNTGAALSQLLQAFLSVLAGTIVYVYLCWSIPTLAGTMLSGSPQLSASGLAGAALGMGAAAVGAAAIGAALGGAAGRALAGMGGSGGALGGAGAGGDLSSALRIGGGSGSSSLPPPSAQAALPPPASGGLLGGGGGSLSGPSGGGSSGSGGSGEVMRLPPPTPKPGDGSSFGGGSATAKGSNSSAGGPAASAGGPPGEASAPAASSARPPGGVVEISLPGQAWSAMPAATPSSAPLASGGGASPPSGTQTAHAPGDPDKGSQGASASQGGELQAGPQSRASDGAGPAGEGRVSDGEFTPISGGAAQGPGASGTESSAPSEVGQAPGDGKKPDTPPGGQRQHPLGLEEGSMHGGLSIKFDQPFD